MTIEQSNFLENFISLQNKTYSDDIISLIKFCTIFYSDDEKLYKEFLNCKNDRDKIIELYAKRYNLNVETDMEQILNIFVYNVINNGIVFHLTSSVNTNSIMKYGLGYNNTEEKQDYAMLKNIIPTDLFNQIEPFHLDYEENLLFYSRKPFLAARYGKAPEWILELQENYDLLEENSKEQLIAKTILNKYNNKYNDTHKVLCMFPSPTQISEKNIKEILKEHTPKEIFSFLLSVLNEKNLNTDKCIVPENILALDLNDYQLYYVDEYE